tara:strand:+ start:586 stop:1386 length:801 start_codon:yes stop_codon:yes gene_type:complete
MSEDSFSIWYWHWHPDLYSGVALLLGTYLILVGPLREKITAQDNIPTKRHVICFTFGCMLMLFALAGPVHELAEGYFFGAHMLQHILITLIVPPLLLLGTPGWLISPVLKYRYNMSMAKFLTHPIIAFISFNIVFDIWHFPSLYDGALKIHFVHILEHIFFMVTAVIMWWPILSPVPELPRLSYQLQMLYLILISLVQTPLFAVITFSNIAIYGFYENTPKLWGITHLADQQIGGIIMKLSWLIIFVPAIGAVFYKWYQQEESKDT